LPRYQAEDGVTGGTVVSGSVHHVQSSFAGNPSTESFTTPNPGAGTWQVSARYGGDTTETTGYDVALYLKVDADFAIDESVVQRASYSAVTVGCSFLEGEAEDCPAVAFYTANAVNLASDLTLDGTESLGWYISIDNPAVAPSYGAVDWVQFDLLEAPPTGPPEDTEGRCANLEFTLPEGETEHAVQWIAGASGTVNSNVIGSPPATSLQVLHGADLGTAVEVAAGSPTATPFEAVEDDTYWFVVTSDAGATVFLNFGSPAVYGFSDSDSAATTATVTVTGTTVKETQEAADAASAAVTLEGWGATDAKTLTPQAEVSAQGANGDIWHLATVLNGTVEDEQTYTHDGVSSTFKFVDFADLTVADGDIVAFKMWRETGEVTDEATAVGLIRQVVYLSHDDTDCFPGTTCPDDSLTGDPVAEDPCARNEVPTDPCAADPTADISDPAPTCPEGPGGTDGPGGGSGIDPCTGLPYVDEPVENDPDAEPPTCNGGGPGGSGGSGSSRLSVTITDPVADQALDPSTDSPYRLKATATVLSGDDDISTVQFLLGDRYLIGEAVTADPYTYDWDFTEMAPGTYQMWARATSTTGAVTTSPWVQVEIVDTEDPLVTITAPIAASTINGAFVLAATVTDNGTIATVTYNIDGGSELPLGGPPYLAVINDDDALAEDAHTITVTATDTYGNAGTATVAFNIGDGVLDPITPTAMGTLFPVMRVRVDELSAPAQAWESAGASTDITQHVRSFSRSFGASNERDQPNTGTCQITLRGPLDLDSNDLPARKLRVEYLDADDEWQIWFDGFLEQPTETDPSVRHTQMELFAVSYQFALAQASLLITRPRETTGARIDALLNEIAWAGGRDIDPGVYTVQSLIAPADGTQQTPIETLNHAQTMAETELGRFYVTPDGTAVYEDRDHRASATRSVVPQAVFGLAGYDSGELPYLRSSLSKVSDLGAVFNRVHLQRANGELRTFTDNDSVDRYWPRAYGENPAEPLTTNRQVDQLGQQILARYKDPHPLIGSITVAPTINTQALWPVVLGMRISDRVTVHHRPAGAAVTRYSCIVEGMTDTVDVDRKSWRQTLTLSQPHPQPVMAEAEMDEGAGSVLGEGVLGELVPG
jgi:hypothetical protein